MCTKRAQLEIVKEQNSLHVLTSLLLKMDLASDIKAEIIKEAFYSPRDRIIRS